MGTCEEARSSYICAEIFLALSPLGERVGRDRRFHQPARAG
jgi:hypothetical protein